MSEIISPTPSGIDRAAELLRKGELVAIPTETVYGLAGDAGNDLAVAKIFATKARPEFNPLIIHVATISQAKQYAQFNDLAIRLAQEFWPGPLTLVLPQTPDAKLSRLATANLPTVAIRIPAHPVALQLLQVLDRPIAAPSANRSGSISPTQAAHVAKSLGTSAPWILDGGECAVGLESTILDLTTAVPTILRLGGLGLDQLSQICGKLELWGEAEDQKSIKAPGMLLRHYAPSIPLRLDSTHPRPNEALLAFGPIVPEGYSQILNLSPTGDLIEAAANLYAHLHALDNPLFSGIASMAIPSHGLGLAINDRLKRAAKGSKK